MSSIPSLTNIISPINQPQPQASSVQAAPVSNSVDSFGPAFTIFISNDPPAPPSPTGNQANVVSSDPLPLVIYDPRPPHLPEITNNPGVGTSPGGGSDSNSIGNGANTNQPPSNAPGFIGTVVNSDPLVPANSPGFPGRVMNGDPPIGGVYYPIVSSNPPGFPGRVMNGDPPIGGVYYPIVSSNPPGTQDILVNGNSGNSVSSDANNSQSPSVAQLPPTADTTNVALPPSATSDATSAITIVGSDYVSLTPTSGGNYSAGLNSITQELEQILQRVLN